MSNGNVPPQETPESVENERKIIHTVYTCPLCEFGSMKNETQTLPGGKIITIRVCRTCGHIQRA